MNTTTSYILAALIATGATWDGSAQDERSDRAPRSRPPRGALERALEPRAEADAAHDEADDNTSATAESARITMNFSGASLRTVLTHMCEAAGFTVVYDNGVNMSGRVNILAPRPVDREEAYKLLTEALGQNNYVVTRDGRRLTVTTRDRALNETPIIGPGVPASQIPQSRRLVTQIVAVKQASAAQLTQDLMPLLAEDTVMTANTAGNALFITATEKEVRRVAEIVEALDGSISSNSRVEVIPLRNADARELATLVRELFDTSATTGRGTGGGNFGGNFGGFNFGGRGFGGGNFGGGRGGN